MYVTYVRYIHQIDSAMNLVERPNDKAPGSAVADEKHHAQSSNFGGRATWPWQ